MKPLLPRVDKPTEKKYKSDRITNAIDKQPGATAHGQLGGPLASPCIA